MKSVVAPYETAAWCVRIECVNGTTVRLTSYPYDMTMSNATVYKTDYGYEPSAYSASSSFSPSAIDLEGIVAVGGITRDALASGVFDNARVYIFKCNFMSPVEDYEPIAAGFFGKTTLEDDRYKVEGMQLIDALNQTAGRSIKPACDARFGDARCGISLAAVKVTGTITAVTSNFVIHDSTRGEAADWFGAGTIRFTSGANAGLAALDIRSFAAGGTITTFDAIYYAPQVGDSYEMIPGCRKRREDCRDKWSNIVNFRGFPDQPTSSTYLARGTN